MRSCARCAVRPTRQTKLRQAFEYLRRCFNVVRSDRLCALWTITVLTDCHLSFSNPLRAIRGLLDRDKS